MIPSISTGIVKEWPVADAIRVIAEAGFPAVELGMEHESRDLERAQDESRALAAIQESMRDCGVRVLQLHGPSIDFGVRDLDAQVDRALRAVRRAAAVGVPWVVFHPGSLDGISADPLLYEENRRLNVEAFSKVAAEAANRGIGIAIENMIAGSRYDSKRRTHDVRFGSTAHELLWLVEQLGRDNVGICWDTGHAEISRIRQGPALRALGSRIVALHVADNDSMGDQHWAPFRGRVDWRDVMSGLKAIGYKGAFNLEVGGEAKATPAAAREAKLAYLRRLSEVLIGLEDEGGDDS